MCFGLNDIGKFPAKRPCGPVNLYNDLVSSVSRRTGRRIVAEICRWRKREGEWGVGSGEWGMGNGKWEKKYHFRFPTPHSPLPIPCLLTAAARVVSRVPVVDCENSTSFYHREARSGLGRRTDVDQGEYPVGAQRQQVAHAVRIALAVKEESAAAAPDDLVIAGAGVELQGAAGTIVLY